MGAGSSFAMLCGCVLFISAQYNLSQRDVETCCEGLSGKAREGLLVSGLLGAGD